MLKLQLPSVCVLSHVWLFVHGLWPSRLLCLWDFPSKNTRVCCHFLLQGILPTQGSNTCLLSPTLAGKFFTTKPSGKTNCLLYNLLIIVCMNVSLCISICIFTLDQKFPKNSDLCSFIQPRRRFFGLFMSHKLDTQKQKFYHDLLTY